jgi:hypothetical protein
VHILPTGSDVNRDATSRDVSPARFLLSDDGRKNGCAKTELYATDGALETTPRGSGGLPNAPGIDRTEATTRRINSLPPRAASG